MRYCINFRAAEPPTPPTPQTPLMDNAEIFRDMFLGLLRNKPIYYGSYKELSVQPPDHTVLNDAQRKIEPTMEPITIQSSPEQRLGPFVIKSGERWFIPDGFDEYCISYRVTDDLGGIVMILPVHVTFILSRNREFLRIIRTDRPDGTIRHLIYDDTGTLSTVKYLRYTGIKDEILERRQRYNGKLTEFMSLDLQELITIFSNGTWPIRIIPPNPGTWTIH